jgi:hypothetical protein
VYIKVQHRDIPNLGVGFASLTNAQDESSLRTSSICVAHLMTTPSIALLRNISTVWPPLAHVTQHTIIIITKQFYNQSIGDPHEAYSKHKKTVN